MDNYDYREFSKIYKRVMDVELKLKRQYKIALKIAFPEKMFYRLVPYLQENLVSRYIVGKGKQRRDKIKDLISAHKSEEYKMNKFIDMAYLSDLIQMLSSYRRLYQDNRFTDNFYRTKVNFNDVKQYGSALVKLRNVIMHFQIDNYKLLKIENLKALAYWEQILLCENCYIHNITISNPSIKNILLAMKEHCIDFDNLSDRYLCDTFDDIALLNGVAVEKLPKYWSIGRQIYEIQSQS